MYIKTLTMFVLICFTSSISVYAFDDKITHRELTRVAIVDNSNINSYLVDFVGYNTGLKSELNGVDRYGYNQKYNILRWFQEGSEDEDNPLCRATNHFHNPIHDGNWLQSQMSDSILVPIYSVIRNCGTKYSNVTWATGFTSPNAGYTGRDGQEMGWDHARSYFYDALTSAVVATREEKFVKTFKSVGMVTHLLQDMAVPAHVRNDMSSHLINATKWGKNPFEYYVIENDSAINNPPVKPDFAAPIRLTDYWDNDSYTGENPNNGIVQGLAEYANANFVSDYTLFRSPFWDLFGHSFKYPSEETSVTITDTLIQDPLYPSDSSKTINRKYYMKTGDGEIWYKLAGVGYDTVKIPTVVTGKTPITTKDLPPMDDYVHSDYAQLLLPRAVGYSSALLDYFFRGKLEITPPNQRVYSIIDGSITPQQFTKIKAKVKNATPGEKVTTGTLVAIARYKIDSSYTPDLSIDPVSNPAAPYVYSVSAPVAVDAAINNSAIEFTFDFSNSYIKIPAGITDLTLQVVFKGTLGNEENIAVAVGMRNISEPTHHVYWNLTDMFSLYYNLYTAETIKARPDLLGLVSDPTQIEPYRMDFEIGYNSTSSPSSVAPTLVSATLPAGRHLRLIGLFDLELPTYAEFYAGRAGGSEFSDFVGATVYPSVVENGSTSKGITPFRHWFSATGPKPFRQHMDTGLLNCMPVSYYSDGRPFCSYPEVQSIDAVKAPYRADAIE